MFFLPRQTNVLFSLSLSLSLVCFFCFSDTKPSVAGSRGSSSETFYFCKGTRHTFPLERLHNSSTTIVNTARAGLGDGDGDGDLHKKLKTHISLKTKQKQKQKQKGSFAAAAFVLHCARLFLLGLAV